MENIFDRRNVFEIEENLGSKEAFFGVISKNAKALGYVENEKDCLNGIMERESQGTTGFQDGFAIPHCKNDTVKSPKLLIFRTKPIPWDSLDGSDITVSHCLLMPKDANNEHLKILAKISRSLIDDDYRNKIKAASIDAIYDIVLEKLEV